MEIRRSSTWERAPWSRCYQCKENTFGFLSGNAHSISLRCPRCRYQVDEPLPDVDKKVIYIDQFIFSELFKLMLRLLRPVRHSWMLCSSTRNARFCSRKGDRGRNWTFERAYSP